MDNIVQLPPYFRDIENATKLASGDVPYHISDINMLSLWSDTNRGKGIKIGYADTGIDWNHPEFEGRVIKASSFARGNGFDKNDHGTHVASTGSGTNVGMAPGSEIYMAQVLNGRGFGDSEWTGKGVDWLASQGCDIISLSLGSSGDDFYTRDAVRAAIRAGIIVVAATTNAGA